MRGTGDLEEDDKDVVDRRRNPADRLNSWDLTVIDGFAGMFRWMIGLFFFFLVEAMAVSGKGTHRFTRAGDSYISVGTLNTRCIPTT